MAMVGPTSANAIAKLPGTAPSSAFMSIVEAVSDTTATAATATELITPMSFAGTNCKWVKVGPNGGKAFFRCKYHVSTAMTTVPIIYVIGAHAPDGTEPNPQFATDGTVPFNRLDALAGVAGISLTNTAASDQRSSANKYTPWYSFTSPYTSVVGDLMGATHILVLCSQASVGGTGTVEIGFLN